MVANKGWFDKLPADIQKALTEDAMGEAKRGREAVRLIGPELVANFAASKIEVHTLTDVEKDVMAKACEPAHHKWLAAKGKSAAPMVKKAKDALAAYRAKKKS